LNSWFIDDGLGHYWAPDDIISELKTCYNTNNMPLSPVEECKMEFAPDLDTKYKVIDDLDSIDPE